MDLAGGAAAWRGIADRAQEGLAVECARAAAREFRAALDVTVPVLTGALRDSMHVYSVSGGGEHAVAVIGSDLIYARFRNDGGTIRVKHAKVLTNGAQFFGRQVTQSGSQYMERAGEWSEGPMQATLRATVAEFFGTAEG